MRCLCGKESAEGFEVVQFRGSASFFSQCAALTCLWSVHPSQCIQHATTRALLLMLPVATAESEKEGCERDGVYLRVEEFELNIQTSFWQ